MKFAAAKFKDPHRGDHWTIEATRRAPGFVPVDDDSDLIILTPWTTKSDARAYAALGQALFVVGMEEE